MMLHTTPRRPSDGLVYQAARAGRISTTASLNERVDGLAGELYRGDLCESTFASLDRQEEIL